MAVVSFLAWVEEGFLPAYDLLYIIKDLIKALQEYPFAILTVKR